MRPVARLRSSKRASRHVRARRTRRRQRMCGVTLHAHTLACPPKAGPLGAISLLIRWCTAVSSAVSHSSSPPSASVSGQSRPSLPAQSSSSGARHCTSSAASLATCPHRPHSHLPPLVPSLSPPSPAPLTPGLRSMQPSSAPPSRAGGCSSSPSPQMRGAHRGHGSGRITSGDAAQSSQRQSKPFVCSNVRRRRGTEACAHGPRYEMVSTSPGAIGRTARKARHPASPWKTVLGRRQRCVNLEPIQYSAFAPPVSPSAKKPKQLSVKTITARCNSATGCAPLTSVSLACAHAAQRAASATAGWSAAQHSSAQKPSSTRARTASGARTKACKISRSSTLYSSSAAS